MSSVVIKRPISISMNVVEIDNYLPSIKMAVRVEIVHPTGNFLYQANDIWFECSQWDNFILSINKITPGSKFEALLEDMSSSYWIKVVSEKEELSFSFKGEESNINEGVANVNFTSIIDEDVLGQIKREFSAFDKWW